MASALSCFSRGQGERETFGNMSIYHPVIAQDGILPPGDASIEKRERERERERERKHTPTNVFTIFYQANKNEFVNLTQ